MLDSLLRGEEGKTLEFKENASSLHRILQTIIAFANTAGGILVIGVRDKTKEVVGIKDVLKEEERIANSIADSIKPLLTPNFQFHTWRNRDVLIIDVAHSIGPYYLKKEGIDRGAYIRLGSTNRMADRATILEIQRLTTHQSFDELPNIKSKTSDIDLSSIIELFSNVGKKFNNNTAKSLHLLVEYQSNYYPSNGALLLFGINRENFFPDSIIRCGCFAGETKSKILDQQDISSSLPEVINKVITFIERNTTMKSEIKRIYRVDIPQYPPVVIREAVLNAIVHADYSLGGSHINIAIFSDRLEITNPGALPFGLSLAKALTGISQLRNRVIGHIFRELGLIERWGSGLRRMIDVCNEQGITPPKFEEIDNFFRVTLYHDSRTIAPKEAWQETIVNHLQNRQETTAKEAGMLWKVTDRTTSTRLKKMCDLGLIVEISTGPFDPKKRFVLPK